VAAGWGSPVPPRRVDPPDGHPRLLPFSSFVVVTALTAAGCGSGKPGGQDIPHRAALQQIWSMYRGGKQNQGRVPRGLDDFQQYKVMYPGGYQALQSGQCVVFYRVDLAHLPDPGQKVLAYEKDAPHQGGSVLMADGTVRTMSADEFRAAPKAGA
jgi:hypothetical protein